MQVPSCSDKCNVKSILDVHLKTNFILIFDNNNHSVYIRSASDLDCCFMATPSWRKQPGLIIMRIIWSNPRERILGCEKRQDEDSSYPDSIEILLWETANRNYPKPEDVDNPMIAPQDFDFRQSERVLVFHNRVFLGSDQQICPGIIPY